MSAFTTQQAVASLSVSNAPHVLATQIMVTAIVRPPNLSQGRASQQLVAPMVRMQAPVSATQIGLEVLARATVLRPKLWLLRQPLLHFIGAPT
jgi:hypothetical protein